MINLETEEFNTIPKCSRVVNTFAGHCKLKRR